MRENIKKLKIGLNYFYDDCSINYDLIKISNYNDLLNDYLPYVVIYIKNN